MGGSVAIQVAAKKVLSNLAGLVVVDVVEVWISIENLTSVNFVIFIKFLIETSLFNY